MLPINCNDIYKQVADELGVNEQLVNDFISHVFSEIRKKMNNLEDASFSIDNIGTFRVTSAKLKKERIRLKKKRYFNHKISAATDYDIINNAIAKVDKDDIDILENKLEKLKWHKENGDPYKKYNKKQEEDCRRRIEFLKKEIECGGYIKK